VGNARHEVDGRWGEGIVWGDGDAELPEATWIIELIAGLANGIRKGIAASMPFSFPFLGRPAKRRAWGRCQCD
jgi:hypothetical protein